MALAAAPGQGGSEDDGATVCECERDAVSDAVPLVLGLLDALAVPEGLGVTLCVCVRVVDGVCACDAVAVRLSVRA